MANKHFVQASCLPMATIRLGARTIPCAILTSDSTTAHVRVTQPGGISDAVTFVHDGEARPARIALRKQGPSGLDLWLELQLTSDVRTA
ncbi:hypothetical protein [Methylobacterium sp. 1030]|uniref:hypothetical protein n=1 Tax=Methylobacterium sp. 1030 TaxID=3156404 RepID=UPI00339566F2